MKRIWVSDLDVSSLHFDTINKVFLLQDIHGEMFGAKSLTEYVQDFTFTRAKCAFLLGESENGNFGIAHVGDSLDVERIHYQYTTKELINEAIAYETFLHVYDDGFHKFHSTLQKCSLENISRWHIEYRANTEMCKYLKNYVLQCLANIFDLPSVLYEIVFEYYSNYWNIQDLIDCVKN